MSKYIFRIFSIIIILLLSQKSQSKDSSVPFFDNNTSYIVSIDSTKNGISKKDTIRIDSTKNKINKKDSVKDVLEDVVLYESKDSLIFTGNNVGHMYGSASVKYGQTSLTGEIITMNLDSNVISSTFGLDSAGKEFGNPVFTEKDEKYEVKKVKYNYKTGKAFIYDLVSQQNEGYIFASKAKRNADKSFYMINGRYTTCNNLEHPHFYLNLSKAKIRPQQDVVTGPAWLVVEDVPLPIALPFAFFPFTSTYSSGVLMPSYGEDSQKGFFLHNGGYYFAISDYLNLSLTGEIYTRGSWGLSANVNYKKRYSYSGQFQGSTLTTKIGDDLGKDIPSDYSVYRDLRIYWTHAQDPKADQYRTFSASVNYSTSRSESRQLQTYSNLSITNTKSSSISYTQRFPDSPWTISATANFNQDTKNETISASFPNVSISMDRVFPFKRKVSAGDEKWYEKISLSYSGNYSNQITASENEIFKKNVLKEWNNSFSHSIPVSATFSLLNYIQVTPSFNYNEKWYTLTQRQAWDPVAQNNVVVDSLSGFYRTYNYSTSIALTTKLYGMYVPLFFKNKISAIRHVFTPSISFSYNPDFTKTSYGFYKEYSYLHNNGGTRLYKYPLYGDSSPSKSGTLNFGFDNNLEMKVVSKKDSTGFKKVSLIDNLGINFSYNIAADSLKFSDISTNIRLKLGNLDAVSISAVWDPYLYEVDNSGSSLVKVNKLRISNGKGFGRLKSTGIAFSKSINQNTFASLFGGKNNSDNSNNLNQNDDNQNQNQFNDGTIGLNPYESDPTGQGSQSSNQEDEFDEYGYINNPITWDLGFNYSISYGYGGADIAKKEYKGQITQNLGFNGSINPTKNWSLNFNGGYDFQTKQMNQLVFSITRKLHCWTMSANFNVVGPYKSYFFVIRANASLLQDLKYEKRASSAELLSNYY